MASLFSEKKEAPDFVICVELPYDGSQTAGTTISTQSTTKKGYEFWLIMMALMVSIFLAALDVTTIATALPSIMNSLHGTDFVWSGSAFLLSSAAFLPMSGGLAQVFGRRPVILGALVFFFVGSAVCATAKNMSMFLAGRATQGVGAAGITALTDIIMADLIPLRERGPYSGMMGAIWALASAIGPPIGGAMAQTNWRWLFYLNLPIAAVAMVLVYFFLNLKSPKDDFVSKLKRIDWTGNFIVVASTASLVIGLSWGGIQNPWTSWETLVPLIVGLAGLVVFFIYEFNWAAHPVVPWDLVSNRTSLAGYTMWILHGILSVALICYLPVYFQASELQTPVQSGVSSFGLAFTIAPAAVACGFLVVYMGKYRPAVFFGWLVMPIALGTLTLLQVDSPKSWTIGFQVFVGIALGILMMGAMYPILAPMPLSRSAYALALSHFVRNLAMTFGMTLGSTILQNVLKAKLPEAFLDRFGLEVAYSLIPAVKLLEEPMRGQVRRAYAEGLRGIWFALIAIAGLGFVAALVVKEIKMPEVNDETWGIEEKAKELYDQESSSVEDASSVDSK